MTHAAADALALLRDDIPVALVPPDALAGAAELVAGLAPIVRCGFEVRLDDGDEVDLQQGIAADGAEHRALLEHLRRTGAEGAAWRGVAALLERWQDPACELHDAIEDAWLEFDDRRAGALSVFVGFSRTAGTAESRLRAARLASAALGGDDLSPAVRRCFEACPPGSFVRHLGMMVGRPAPFVRVNVRHVEPAGLAGYLAAVGWEGEAADATALARELAALVDGVTLCLDVGTSVQRRLGFEAHGVRGAPAPCWEALLGALVARGWCTAAKRDALLAWPGLVTPSAGGHWPAGLARDALLRPADHFTAIARVISHVKLVLTPGRPVQAKGYIGFEHRWLRPPPDRDPPRRPGTTALRGVAGGVAFLLDARTAAGWWRDFTGALGAGEEWGASMGSSDEYVTAYVTVALAAVGTAHAREAAERAWTLLARRRAPVAGWGWNGLLPVDADSTAWGLRAADAVGAGTSPIALAARRALDAHRMPDGGVSSYRAAARPRPHGRDLTPPDASYAGWTATSHACVTAAAAGLGDPGALAFLRAAQREDGSWASYWWLHDEFATAFAARALAATGARADARRAAAAADWAAGRIDAGGAVSASPFATALAVLALGGHHEHERVRAVGWLAERQEDDGGWAPSARLLAPRPDVVDRLRSPVETVGCLDDARSFTTATVIAALAGSAR